MNLTDKHLQAIRAAALPVEYGSVTIKAGTDNHLDIIVENRLRLPKEPENKNNRPPLLTANEGAKHNRQL
jgi:hypothetical protein